MRHIRINIPDTSDSIHFIEGNEFEFANPFEIFFKIRLQANLMIGKEILSREYQSLSHYDIEKLIYLETIDESNKENQKLLETEIPQGLLRILDLNTKDEQIDSLKGIALTFDEMQAFTLKAYKDYGYSYSLYSSEHHHKGLDKDRIPKAAFKDKTGQIVSSNDTNMTSGEIKQMIEHRKMTVSKFFDKGDKWHCFFLTYKSIGGKELSYKYGQPHMHYISNAFGMTRDRVLNELRSIKYKLNAAPHIDYYTHRNPKKDDE